MRRRYRPLLGKGWWQGRDGMFRHLPAGRPGCSNHPGGLPQQKGSSLLVQLAAEGCPIGPGVRRGSRSVADPHDVIGGRPFAAGRRPRQVDLVLPVEGELPRFGLLELPDVVVAHWGPSCS